MPMHLFDKSNQFFFLIPQTFFLSLPIISLIFRISIQQNEYLLLYIYTWKKYYHLYNYLLEELFTFSD